MNAEPPRKWQATVLPEEIDYDPDEAGDWGAFAETALTPAEAADAAEFDEQASRHAMVES